MNTNLMEPLIQTPQLLLGSGSGKPPEVPRTAVGGHMGPNEERLPDLAIKQRVENDHAFSKITGHLSDVASKGAEITSQHQK